MKKALLYSIATFQLMAASLFGHSASTSHAPIEFAGACDRDLEPVLSLQTQYLRHRGHTELDQSINQPHYGSSPHSQLTQGLSLNWSGYAVIPKDDQRVSAVSGSWTVPDVSSSTRDSICSFFVGIDGYSSPTVEQIGTNQLWCDGEQINYAWYEMYPQGLVVIDPNAYPVEAGDKLHASVTLTDCDTFLLSIANQDKDWHFEVSATSPGALLTSAEWIVESPTGAAGFLPLADYHKGHFHHCKVTINGVTGGITNRSWKHDKLSMVGLKLCTGNIFTKSKPYDLSEGGHKFKMRWKHY